MNQNSINAGLAQTPDVVPDPGVGNTTVGSGKLPNNTTCIVRLIATQAATQEERTLADPQNAGIELIVVLTKTAGANLRINSDTKVNVAGNTHMLFTAVDHVICFKAVPIASAANVAIPKYRWEIMCSDGPSLS